MPNMTPVRIRGKRAATEGEKWHARKQRKASRHPFPRASNHRPGELSARPQARVAARKSRKRVNPDVSRLEQLPTEVLQSIFEYSANLDLPLASPRLAAQLQSQLLYHHLTSQVLHKVLGKQSPNAATIDVADSERLMNRKFFTWPFLRQWLHTEFEQLPLLQDRREVAERDERPLQSPQHQECSTWNRLCPSPALAPPMKLLRRPFTDDKIRFLKLITASFRNSPETLDAVYKESVQDGLQQAVEDGASDTLDAFFSLGAQVDTELLRKAVIDSDCKQDVVQALIMRSTHLTSYSTDVDFLDPALWSWADTEKARGDEMGPWLIEQLRAAAQDSGQEGRGVKAK